MKSFNIVIAGVGGQGLITLTQVIAEAAVLDGYDVKTSELHGLSQRQGSVQTHIRFGDKIYSPLISNAGADLIFGLEISEALRNINFANSKTVILTDKYFSFYQGSLKLEQVVEKINSLFKGGLLISASEICKKELGSEVFAGIYLLGYAINKKLIPLKSSSVLEAISEIVPEKHLETNKKAFNLAKNNS